jgi:hypothetical protein
MKKLRLTGVAGLALAAVAIPVTDAAAKQTKSACPKSYQAVPTQAVPPGEKDDDRNDNFVVCAKGPQGSNGHFNVKDDRTGQNVTPAQWTSILVAQDPLQDIWISINHLDSAPNYFLDPLPVDVVDDVPVQ